LTAPVQLDGSWWSSTRIFATPATHFTY
jgi:hypothetical protein